MQDRRIGDGASAQAGVGNGVRLAALGVCLLEVAGTLVGSALKPDGTAVEFGPLTIFQCLLVVAAATALLWKKHWLGGVLAAVSTVLSLTVHSIGSDHLLWLLIGVIAGLRGNWPVRVGCLAAGTIVGCVAAWETSALYPGWSFRVGAFLILLVVVGVSMGYLAKLALRVIDRARARAQELERETEQIRHTERLRLADDLQVLLENGLDELHTLSTQTTNRPLEELRGTLTSVDEVSRGLLGQTRQLLLALREPGETNKPGDEHAIHVHTRRGLLVRACASVILLGVGLSGLLSEGPSTASWFQLAACAAAAVTIWRAVPGIVACAACLVAAVTLAGFEQPVGLWGALPTAVACLVIARYRPRLLMPAAVVVALLVAYFVTIAISVHDAPSNSGGQGWLHGYAAIAGFLVGLSWRSLQVEGAKAESTVAKTTQSRDTAIDHERQTLARELHDVVAHQLSITTMMIMASSASDERAVLIGVLDRLRQNIDSARAELHALLEGLRSTETTGALVTPQRMAEQLRAELTDAGFETQMDIATTAADLEPAQLRTVVRAMQEAASNMLRYAAPATLCGFCLRVDPARTSLEITSSLSERPRRSDLSNGMGLRGIRERVDLLGGSFHAGPHQGRWLLSVELPHSRPVPAINGSALAAAQQAVLPSRGSRARGPRRRRDDSAGTATPHTP